MVKVIRVEAAITAQSKLRPGLAQAAAEMSRFRAMQAKATAAFGSTAARAMVNFQQKRAALASAAQAHMVAAGRNQLVTLGGPAALAASYKQYADVDRQITRIGITANASAEELTGVRKQIEGIAYETAQSSGKVTGGLDVLVAQGRTLKESLGFLPSVARTAAAANAEVDDIAKTADAVASNFKIAGNQMQRAFDIMSEGGKAGQFELKDQARYLPSIAPAASAAGFSGTEGLTQLVALMQVMRKGTGTSEEAASSLNNIFQKMESEETVKRFKKFGIDLRKEMTKARKEGKNLVEVFGDLTDKALKGDLSKIPQLFSDMEMARGMRALLTNLNMLKDLIGQINKQAPGSVGRDLTRVTADARAQIDHMMSALENRAVQLGGVLAKHVVLPLDKALRDIADGKNTTVNRVEEWARHHNADGTARIELDGGSRHDLDPDDRRLVDARKEFLARERLEDERARLTERIAANEAKRDQILKDRPKGATFGWQGDEASRAAAKKTLDDLAAKEKQQGSLSHADKANRKGLENRLRSDTDPLDQAIAVDRARLEGINALAKSVDELNLKLAELQGLAAHGKVTRMSQPPGAPELPIGTARFEEIAEIVRLQQKLQQQKKPTLSFADTPNGGHLLTPTGKPTRTETPLLQPNGAATAEPEQKGSASNAATDAGLDRTKAKAEEVTSTVQAIGPAGREAGAAMATGFVSAFGQMDAAVDAFVARTNQKLKQIVAPTIGINTAGGGTGGFNTGKQGPN